MPHDAVLVLSFGGPEGPDDVMPFLDNVTRGRAVPPSRLAAVARHYDRFGGVSPINAANRALVAALEPAVAPLPVYWGNRNWHPLLTATVQRMAEDGVRRAACFVTSAYGGYSACDQYLEDLARARAEVGPGAPSIDKLPLFYDHPGFLTPFVEGTVAALERLPAGSHLVFTAHSVPVDQPGADTYAGQVHQAARLVATQTARTTQAARATEAARLVATQTARTTQAARAAERPGPERPWAVAWQSRSGPPSQPWLEPDVVDHLEKLAAEGAPGAVLVPIGFVADHLEVVYDLDVEAAARAGELGLPVARVATPGTHPAFVTMIAELVGQA